MARCASYSFAKTGGCGLANGDAAGALDLAAAATFGIGKGLAAANKLRKAIDLKGAPKYVRGSTKFNSAKRNAATNRYKRFNYNVLRPYKKTEKVYGVVSSAVWAYQIPGRFYGGRRAV